MALTDTRIRTAKPAARPYKLSDGGGLHLLVATSGSRLWRLQYRFNGKQKLLAFGAYPYVTLAAARAKRDASKSVLAEGFDPCERAKLAKLARLVSSKNTFTLIADEYLAKLAREGRSTATLKKVSWLLDFARPLLSAKPIAEITAPEVLAVLRQLENRGTRETARRLRSTIGSVFRYAIATARAERDPTLALKGALLAPVVKPRAAITDAKQFGLLLQAIDGFDGRITVKAGLQLMALLFPRPGELRQAGWREFDFDSKVWTIPALRTKTRREHRVPLPVQAVAVLDALRQVTGSSPLLLPNVRSWRRPISENTLNAGLRQLGYGQEQMTAHGFRATASTLLNESRQWHADAIERQLAHVETNDVRRAYARGEHWDERVAMMQWWADHLDALKGRGQGYREGTQT